ncbi:Hypothetical protein ABZS17H1_01879 [Kosakonia cowanii]
MPKAIDKIFYGKTTAVTHTLIVHRSQALLLTIKDINHDVVTSTVQVANK